MCEYDFPIYDIKEGDMFRVKGIYPNDNNFRINFLNGPSHLVYDIPLHFKLDANMISCHTRQNGIWTYSQKYSNPRTTEKNFDYVIIVGDTHFKLAVNGTHIGDYKHQMPISASTHLNVHPNINVTSVSFEPAAATKTTNLWPLCSGIKVGSVVRVRGVVPLNNGFDINFQNGEIYKMCDMPFCMQFTPIRSLFNTYNNNDWQDAETYGTLITPGRHFDIQIICEATQFKIIFNGDNIKYFEHRMSISGITCFTVTKYVQVEFISFTE